jgi:hypothetical protein
MAGDELDFGESLKQTYRQYVSDIHTERKPVALPLYVDKNKDTETIMSRIEEHSKQSERAFMSGGHAKISTPKRV